MKIRLAVFPFVLILCSGCAAAVPVLIGSGGTAAYFYYQEKAEGVYRIPLEDAYPVAVRSLGTLNLKIIDIEVGEERRVISAKNPVDDSRNVTFTLESAGPGFTKATIWAKNYSVIPDQAYGKMVLKVFTEQLAESRDKAKDKDILVGGR